MNAKALLSDDELLALIQSLLGSERRMVTQLVRYLAEVEDRRRAVVLVEFSSASATQFSPRV